jgi:hypothetical protein
MKVTVRIASGALLANSEVTVELAPATGALLSAVDFIKRQFGLLDPMVSDDPPKLDPQTATAVTDKHGVARFAIVVERGPPEAERKLVFKTSNGLTSDTTRVISLINPISAVAPVTGIEYRRTGLNAIGSTWTEKVRVKGMAPEKFPVLLKLPDTTVAIRSATRYGRTVQPRAVAKAFELRTFSTDDLATFRQKREDAQEAMGALVDEAEAFRDSSQGQEMRGAGDEAYRIALNSDDPAQALRAYTPPVNASELKDYAKQNGRAVLNQFVKLLMSGTNPLTTDPTGKSSKAEIWAVEGIWAGSGDIKGQDDVEDASAASAPIPPFTVTASHAPDATRRRLASINEPNSTVLVAISDLYIVVRSPGTYRLQPVVAGIAGDFLPGVIEIAKFTKANPAAIALEYAFRIIAVGCVASMALGASDFHRAIVFVPLSFLWITAVGLVLMLEDGPIAYPVGEYYEIGTWWVVTLVLIAWFTFTGALGVIIGIPFPWFLPFNVKRRQAYYSYCQNLVKRPSTEVGRLLATLARLKAAGTLTLAEKGALEKKVANARADEKDYFVGLTRIFKGVFNYGGAAFFFPQRMLGAFVISVFSVGFMCGGVVRWCAGYRLQLEQMDTRATLAMYSMARVLQQQFYSITGEDLPADATDFLEENANTLHGHILSFGEAIFNGIVGGCVVGFLSFLFAWGVHFLEFRQQVLRARRGEWDFDWRRTSTVLVVTFVGTSISNAMFVFLFTCVMITPVLLVLSWSVTWEYIKYVLGNETMLVILVIIPLVHFLIKFGFRHIVFADRHTIRYRYLFMAYDMYEVLMTCVAGIMRSVLRMVMVIFGSLLTLPRIDRSPFPSWLEYYFLLDTGSKSFQGMIKLYHWHNHPVMRVTAWILTEDAEKRRNARDKNGMVSPKLRMISNRWWKLWMMTKNPVLAQYSSRNEAELKAKEARDTLEIKSILISTPSRGTFLGGSKKKQASSSTKALSDVEMESNH